MPLTCRRAVVQWLALEAGCTVFAVIFIAFAFRGRGVVQRSLDVVLAILAVRTVIAACGVHGYLARRPAYPCSGRPCRETGGSRRMVSRLARFRGPLADSYLAAVALVVFALVPYLALTAAINPLLPVLSKDLPLSQQALQLTTGMANAAYAFGTVVAVQFAVHLRGRRMLLLYASLFVVGSVLAALAPTPGLFIAGHVVQGLTTSLMLIAAVPPLVTGWPTSKMPWTGFIMNICIFGAVAVGPVIGGVQAGALAWRPLFWIIAGLGALAFLFVILTFEDQEPQDRSAPWDWVAIVLAGGGSAAAFFGASELLTHRMLDVIVFLPLLGGVAMIVALVVHQYFVRRPLMPVRQLATTFPVAGITIAMCAGAVSVGLVTLVQTALESKSSPTHLAMLFWPEFGAAIAATILFGFLFRTRFVPLLALGGMFMLTAGAAVLTGVAEGSDALVVIGSGLVGLGVGGAVSPACSFPVSRWPRPRSNASSRSSSCFAAWRRSSPHLCCCTWR